MLKQVVQRTRFLIRVLTRRKLDVLDMLEADHIRVELLFLQWKLTRDTEGRQKIFETIQKELKFHAQIEENIFYPACEKVRQLKSKIGEANEEHHQFKLLLNELS